jgi:chaperonin GroES
MIPLRDLLIIKRDPLEEMTTGGVIKPDTAVELPSTGEVVQVGPQAQDVRIGDRVLISGYSGEEQVIEDVTYIIVPEKNVLVILSRAGDTDVPPQS